MKRVISAGVCLLVVSLLAGAGAVSAQIQGDQQQACINKVNKDAIKVAAAQGKANNGCVKDFVKGVLPTTADACILNDPKNLVEGKQANLTNDEGVACVSPLPDFCYTGHVTTNAAAYQAEVDLAHDVYGNPLDGGLDNCDTHPAECLCERQAIGRVEKISRALGKIFVKCKKKALAIGKTTEFPLGAASASDVATCITNGVFTLSVQADTKTKVATAQQQLQDTVAHFCFTTPNNEFDNGVCNTFNGNPAGLADCLTKQAKCRFCKMENAIDGMAVDCATWSGAGANCP